MTYMFGNPGTVEQGFLDALWDFPDLQYVLTLQETVAVMMADGYARATQRPTVVQIHSSPGLGNAIGALYQAYRGHAPLVVIGGDAGVKYQAMDAQMAADLVVDGQAGDEVVDDGRRSGVDAARVAAGDQDRRHAADGAGLRLPAAGRARRARPSSRCGRRRFPRRASCPTSRCSSKRPRMLRRGRPADDLHRRRRGLVAGAAGAGARRRTARRRSLGSRRRRAEHAATTIRSTRAASATCSPSRAGRSSRKGDVNLIVGTYMLPEVFPSLDDIFAADAKTIHIDLNAYEIAKNHPVTLGLVSDPKLTLARLADALGDALQIDRRAEAAAERGRRDRRGQAAKRRQGTAAGRGDRDARAAALLAVHGRARASTCRPTRSCSTKR